jgi:hypothetical protein
MTFVEVQSGAMAHSCNPSYSGGRDQEDCGLKASLGTIEILSQK